MNLNQLKSKMMEWDVHRIRQDFPILHQKVHGKPLVYFDNAATTQKPKAVLEAMQRYYEEDNANIHRGVHTLSERATASYEAARATIQSFINAPSEREIIFTKGATESINLVAHSFGQTFMKAGDSVLLSAMEHHANIVPWQLLREERGIHLKVIPMNEVGELDLSAYEALLTPDVKIVALTHTSNVLGTVNPVRQMIELAHARQIPVLLDGAQSIVHQKIDVQDLNCDFFVFSGHKLYGPTGTGVLYGKRRWLEKMRPFLGGGDMIRSVTFEKTTFNELPYKFEAGTPNIAGAIGLATAIDYLDALGMDRISAYETELLNYATQALKEVPGIRIIGESTHKAALISFILDSIHPHDIGSLLDRAGIATRAGHHCAMPVMNFFKVPATTRVSFSFYNTHAEIDAFIRALYAVKELFHG